MNISDYINTSRINEVINDMQNFTFQKMMSQGIFGFGFSPYTDILTGFFWSLTFGIIGVAIYSWKGLYPTIGYFVAILLITGAVLPASMFSMFGIFLGLIITAVLYEVLIVRKRHKTKEVPE